LETYRTSLSADGKDLAYVTASIVDKDGNLCPLDGRLMTFSVLGTGSYRASANGDPTCLDIFHEPQMHAFGGKLTVIVQAGESTGNLTLIVKAKGLQSASLTIPVE
jgi:beta-galactosidase